MGYKKMSKNIHLITGGAGFVGINIAKQLIAAKETVIITDVWQPDNKPKNFEYLDVTDRTAVDKLLKHVTHVHHNAALVPLTKAGKRFQEVNVGGTRNVIDMALKHKIKMLCHMSSSAIYGIPENCPIPADTPLQPVEIYGRSKALADKMVQQAMKDGMPACSIRPRTIIGQERLGIFEILFNWIKDNANIFILGKGDNLFQFVHIDDIASVSVKAALLEKSGLFNVGAEPYGSLRHDLEKFIKTVGSKSKVISLPIGLAQAALTIADKLRLSPLAPFHYASYHKDFYYEPIHITKALGWKPKYGNVEMMVESYQWYIKNFSYGNKKNASIHRKPVAKGILAIAKQVSKIF